MRIGKLAFGFLLKTKIRPEYFYMFAAILKGRRTENYWGD